MIPFKKFKVDYLYLPSVNQIYPNGRNKNIKIVLSYPMGSSLYSYIKNNLDAINNCIKYYKTDGDTNLCGNKAIKTWLDDNGTEVSSFGATVVIGEVGASKSNVQITSGAINLRNNTTTKMSLSAAGAITIGNNVLINSSASISNLGIGANDIPSLSNIA